MNKYLLLLASVLFFSCTEKENKNDHPAYHNPSVQAYTDSIVQHPDVAQFYFLRAEALSSINQDSLALTDVMTASGLDSLNPQYLYTIGYLNLKLEKPGKAITVLKKNLDLSPGNVNVRLLLSKAYLADNNIAAALTETNKVLAAAPAHTQAMLTLAQIKIAQKDTTAAIGIARQLLATDKNNYQISYQLADWYKAQHNPEAVAQYQYTFSIDTNDVSPLFEIGDMYEQQQQTEKAKAAYKACIMKDLDYTDAYLQMGKILYRQDSVEKALRQFNIAISTAPSSADAYLYKGLSFQKMNLKDSAIAALRQALVFDEELKEAREALSKIKK